MSDKNSFVSLVLVTYNRLESLKNVINALKNYNWQYDQFVIIDNNSDDGTADYLKGVSDDLKAIVLFNNENVGHGAALANGFEYLLKKSKSQHYVLLEDDSIPNEKMIDKLVDSIEKSNFDVISTYGMNVSLGKRIGLSPKMGEILQADFCLFDGAIIKSKVIQSIGVPEKNWFMMFDDYEYCYRIRKNNFRIGVIINDFHEILHLGGGEKYSKSSLWRGYYQSRNHTFFLKKHFSLFNFLDYLILQLKRTYGALPAPDRWTRVKFRLIGVYHGIIQKKGKTLQPKTLRFK